MALEFLDKLDPSTWKVSATGYMDTAIVWASILMWVLIICFVFFMFIKFMQYKIPVEIFEKRGTASIIVGRKKAKRTVVDNVEQYELLWNMAGIFPFIGRKHIKMFRIDSPEFAFATTKGISFKLEKVGDTFQPIKIANPNIELYRVPQNLLWWLSNKIVNIKDKYSDRKWWEPYILPLSVVVVVIIEFIIVAMVLDKAAEVSSACGKAEASITSKVTQAIK